MALVIKDRVRVTSTTAGTGTFTLGAAATGYQDFNVIGSGNYTYYTIADQSGANWEVGVGLYTSPNQLQRLIIFASSNSNNVVNFGAGTKDVFVTLPAERAVYAAYEGGPNVVNAYDSIVVNSTDNFFNLSPTTAKFVTTDSDYYYGLVIQNAVAGTSSYFHFGVNNTGDSFIETSGSISFLNALVPFALPTTSGSNNNILQTDGSGNTSWMDLGSPPAIGGTTPNTITGTTVTVWDQAVTGTPASFVIYDPITTGVTCTFTIDPATYLPTISATDGSFYYPLQLNSGVTFPAGVNLNVGLGNSLQLVSSTNSVTSIYANNSTYVPYSLYLPSSAGSNNQVLKTDGSGNLDWIYPAGQAKAPVTFTTTTYTVASTDIYIIGNCNTGNMTITLPAASTNSGRVLTIKTTQNRTVGSASSNVVSLNGGAAGTAILSGVAGKFAQLVSDGTNWIIMQAN